MINILMNGELISNTLLGGHIYFNQINDSLELFDHALWCNFVHAGVEECL